jgi:hypothetical protein
MDPQTAVQKNGTEESLLKQRINRRKFLFFTGTAAASAAFITACGKEDGAPGNPALEGVNLGSGDFGILNYAYALEQLEAAFYIQVMATPYASMPAIEAEYLKDIRDHEVAHREFFAAALGSNKIANLEVDFSSINFGSRDSVLGTAKTFEDLGVSAYNGAGKLLQSADFLLLAGKIVSVEARHAALIRELITPGSFADLNSLSALGANNASALDAALNPPQVLAAAAPFIKTKINASNLPTS